MKLIPFLLVACLSLTLVACPKKKMEGEGETVEGSSTPATEKSNDAPADEMQPDKKAGDAAPAAEPAAEEKK